MPCEASGDLEMMLMLWAKTTASCRRQDAGETGTWWAKCAKADKGRVKGVYIKAGHGFSLKKAKKGGNGKRVGSKPVRLQQSWTLTAGVVASPATIFPSPSNVLTEFDLGPSKALTYQTTAGGFRAILYPRTPHAHCSIIRLAHRKVQSQIGP